MAACFSEDILTEILKRLHVSSLIKLMLVQKSWYRLIQSPYFNKALYSYHQKNTTYILFRSGNNFSLRVNAKQCYQYSSLPFPEDIKLDGVRTVPEISNGLICLSYSRPLAVPSGSNGVMCLCYSRPQQIFLWNPVIRKYKTLPRYPIPEDSPCCRFNLTSLVFGFVPKFNDYKVIDVVKYLDEGGKYPSNKADVLVYSLSTNSWKIVKDKFTKANNFMKPVIVNGAAYWIGIIDVMLVVCFDIESEIIREIMLPSQYRCQDSYEITLKQNSCDLFLFATEDSNYYPSFLDILILGKEDGIKDVWTKKFRLDLEHIEGGPDWSPECFSNCNEIILISDYPHRYMSYDIEKNESTDTDDDLSDLYLALDIDILRDEELFASLFVESLGLLGDKS